MLLVIYRKELSKDYKIEGYKLFTEEDWDNFELKLNLYNKEILLYPVESEYIVYKDGKELLDELQIIFLSTDEEFVYEEYLGLQFGYFPKLNIKLTNE